MGRNPGSRSYRSRLFLRRRETGFKELYHQQRAASEAPAEHAPAPGPHLRQPLHAERIRTESGSQPGG